ncbi:MAG: hypothetical protein ACFE8P_01745 [Promethearchaeota archaeon]
MAKYEEDKGCNPKLEGYKLHIERWHFLVESFWSRFNVFITILVIATGFLGVIIVEIFSEGTLNKSVWLFIGIISLFISFTGVLWFLMLTILNYEIKINIKKAQELEKELDIGYTKEIDQKNFPLMLRIPLKLLVDIFLWAAIILFLFLAFFSILNYFN